MNKFEIPLKMKGKVYEKYQYMGVALIKEGNMFYIYKNRYGKRDYYIDNIIEFYFKCGRLIKDKLIILNTNGIDITKEVWSLTVKNI